MSEIRLRLNSNFAFDCTPVAIGRDGDVGAAEVAADFKAAGERYREARFEFSDMYGKRTRTKTHDLGAERTVTFPLPAEVTDTVGVVEMQAVLTGKGVVRKTDIVTLEVSESLNGEDGEVVGAKGQYCPLLFFRFDENGRLTLLSADESGRIGIETEDGNLIVDFPNRYAVETLEKTDAGRAEIEITLEEERTWQSST